MGHEKVHVICENLCLEEGMTKEQIESTYAKQTAVEALASGSPKGSYATATALKTANPNTGVYVAQDNGHVYSWTKNQSGDPIDLGVYQATSISENDPVIIDLKNNSRLFKFNILNSLAIGYGVYNDTYINNNPKRAVTVLPVRIHEGDVIKLKFSHNDYRIILYYFDDEFNLVNIDNTFWTNINLNVNVIQCDNSGYLLVYLKQVNDLDLKTYTGNSIEDTVSLILNSNYEQSQFIDEIIMGQCIAGSNKTVSITQNNIYLRTNFIKVYEGQKISYTGNIAGIAKNSNIRGIAGFSDANVDSFVKWLWNIEIDNGAPLNNDKLMSYEDIEIIIPKGINYIMVDAYFDNGNTTSFPPNRIITLKSDINDRISSIIDSENSIKMCLTTSQYIGDCLLFKMPNQKVLMIDTSETSALTNIQKCLTDMNIYHIDYFIISHHHSDHIDNINWFITNGYIDSNTNIYLPPDPSIEYMDAHTGDITKANVINCLNLINNLGATVIYPTENQIVNIDEVEIEFFNTNHESYYENDLNYNMMSLCNYITYGNMRICCTGDLVTQWYLQYNPNHKLKKCNILKTPHHAGHSSLNNKLMQWLNPDICVTSMGKYYATEECIGSDVAKNVLIKNTTDSIQTWCENHNVSNYITGANDSEILIDITKDSFKIDNSVKATDRYVEGFLTR